MTLTLKIEREVQPSEIAYMLFGTGLFQYPWWGHVDWGHEEDGEDFPIDGRDQLEAAEETDYIIVQHDARDDDEGDLTGRIRLTFAQILAGVAAALKAGHLNADSDGVKEDLGLFDAEDADLVLQYAVFGEAVYG